MSARSPRRCRAVLALALVVIWVAGSAAAQNVVPYTVQVAALSDADAAIDLSGALLRDGFPSYVVRAEGAAGSVFRVRVGAFGDRGSADRYATAMAIETATEPRPALAEAIPSGILPLAPTRWFRIEDGQRAALLPWGEDALVARLALGSGPFVYLLDDGRRFEAWWARARTDGGRDELAVVALDAAAAAEDDASVREALFRQRIRLIAERGGFDPDRLIDEAVRGMPGERTIVLWREVPVAAEERVRGVVRREAEASSRATDDWIGEVAPVPVEPLIVIDANSLASPSGPFEGEGWIARGDAPWTVLDVGMTAWRAVVGTPRAAVDDVLVVRVAGGFEALRLLVR